LWERCPTATPFQSPAWLIPWWRHFAPGELFTLAVFDGDVLAGLAPFYIENGALGRRLLPVGISLSDYHDVLLDPERMADAWQALLVAALGAPEAWERWEWEELMPGALALSLPFPEGCVSETAPHSACPVLTLGGPDLTECLPKTKRRKLNLARNRAERRGPVIFNRVDDGSIDEALDQLFRLNALRWERQGEPGTLAEEPVRQFHREAAPLLNQAGMLRLFTLRFGEKVVAAYYGFQHGERAYAYLSGFDPEHEFESPGTLLVAHAINEALGEGAREFHFLRGQEPYKYAWGAVDRWNQRRSIRRTASRDAAA
jgi:CelD/BcsL family acetyltransferase involved in cellulose biosynthesis